MTPSDIYGSATTMRSIVNDWQRESTGLGDLENQLWMLLERAAASADPAATVIVRVGSKADQGAAITDIPVQLPLFKLIEAKRAEIADKMEALASLSADLEDACHKLLTFAPDEPKPEPAHFTVDDAEPPVTKRAAATVTPPPLPEVQPLVGAGRVVSDDSIPFRSPDLSGGVVPGFEGGSR